MQIGIDQLAFATTDKYLSLVDLANARGEDPNKYLIGIGQERQAVVPPTQDIVTLGATAATNLPDGALDGVTTLIVATESGIDNSKAAGIYVKRLLGLDNYVRVVEVKEACYSATAALQFARGLVALNPDDRVLVIATDIARYGLATSGEVTQGAGAVAFTVTKEPRVLVIEEGSVAYTDDIMDFWRPLYSTEAMVDGKYSTQVYIDFYLKTFNRYSEQTGLKLEDFAAMAFHLPFTKMGKKGLEGLLGDRDDAVAKRLRANLTADQALSREVGNLYTGSLYLGLLSLLLNGDVQPGERIGLFSYGSGAEGEFYSGILQSGWEQAVVDPTAFLEKRTQVSVAEYEDLFNAQLGMNADDVTFDTTKDSAPFVLAGQKDHQRIYERK